MCLLAPSVYNNGGGPPNGMPGATGFGSFGRGPGGGGPPFGGGRHRSAPGTMRRLRVYNDIDHVAGDGEDDLDYGLGEAK